MADYWKSLPKKFCEYCKCYIADNKPSIEFHENGLRHKGNVERRLKDIRYAGQQAYYQEQEWKRDMKKMEKDAWIAYEKDKATLAGETAVPTPVIANEAEPSGSKEKKKKKKTATVSKEASDEPFIYRWFQVPAEDGGKPYYWNAQTGVTTWDVPKERFMPLRSDKKPEEEGVDDEPPPEYLPEGVRLIGPWVPVETHSNEPQIDLQLPQTKAQFELNIFMPKDKPKVSFKEKVVTLAKTPTAISSGPSGFKKRKSNTDDKKRNMRQRLDDD